MNTTKIAILFSGNGSNLENLYLKLHNKTYTTLNDEEYRIEVCLAVSSRSDAFGIKRCENLGLKCELLSSRDNKIDYDKKLIDILKSYNIELVLLAGFMRVLSENFCDNFIAINIHPSILPLFKGANAIVESYNSDMKIAGVSVHFVSKELDAGKLIAQESIQKIDGEDFSEFKDRIHTLEHDIYPKAVLKVLSCKN